MMRILLKLARELIISSHVSCVIHYHFFFQQKKSNNLISNDNIILLIILFFLLQRMLSASALVLLEYHGSYNTGVSIEPATGKFCCLLPKSLPPTFYIKFHLTCYCRYLINI